MSSNVPLTQSWIASLDAAALERLKSELSEEEAASLLYAWERWARPSQRAPEGTWDGWLIIAGRGWGKTRVGSETLRSEVESGRATHIGLIGETSADGRDVIVEGESGILATSPPWFRPVYEPSKRRLTWPNGATATLYDAREPDQLRGPQHDFCWFDAVADRPFQPYTGEMIAPANPMLNQSFGMFGDIANNNIGASTLNSAMDATKGVAGYQPGNITAGTLPGTDLSGYLNPFQKNVIDTTMADLERQRQIAQMGDAQKVAAAGAWGGSRSGVAQAETNNA